LPVQEAELKAGNSNAPSVDEDHYSIIVLGIPSRLVRGDGAADAGRLQPHAEIRREGGKPIKSSSARILVRDEGPVVVFQFPRSEEIPARLKQVEFQGRIGPLEVDQVFPLADMIFAGKLEL
jgi:hypothetical protein